MIHDCPFFLHAEAWFEEDGSDIYLNLNRVATEKDLESDHYLEYEGQTIETVKIRVTFCPYCGEKLGGSDEVVVPQFQHFSFGGGK